MANNTYAIQYATTGRASCKAKHCRKIIDKDTLRIAKKFPSARFTDDGNATDWFHVPCYFQVQLRVKKGTKKIETPDDLEGFGDLKPEDQKMIKKYITGAIEVQPPPKMSKGAKAVGAAVAAASSPAPSPPASPAKANKGKPTAVSLDDGRTIELPLGKSTYFGRGDLTGITDKRCSRTQVEVLVSNDGRVQLKMNGVNPSILIRANDEKIEMEKDSIYDAEDGDSFCVLVDEHQWVLKWVNQLKRSASDVVAAAAAAGSGSEDNTSSAPKPKKGKSSETPAPAAKPTKKKGSDDEGKDGDGDGDGDGSGLPECPYGKACYRKNPQHFKEFSHTK